MGNVVQRFHAGWNAFLGRDPTNVNTANTTIEYYVSSSRPDRLRFTANTRRSIVSSIYNRIAVDVASINFNHSKLDDNNGFKESIDSGLNNCITLDANTDQTGRALIQDIVQSMFDEGVVAVVPTDTDYDPTTLSERYEVLRLRTGRITKWYPSEVCVRLYNERTGRYEEIRLPKSMVAIIENPFYAIMNEPNSVLQRLIRTINRMDAINEASISGKLDLIIQLPYVVKSEQKKLEAEKRRKDLENQLEGSKYGVAWIDGTEHVTQLNRAVENNLWEQVKDLTTQLYNQLGLTPGILDGSANESVMINYFNNTVSPICTAICDEFNRKFLSKTARSQKQRVVYYRDPFKLVPVSQLAEIADKFRRNEIMTSNEIRSEIGLRPSDESNANELRNPNLNRSDADMDDAQNKANPELANDTLQQVTKKYGGVLDVKI